jgi:hypothetical protein
LFRFAWKSRVLVVSSYVLLRIWLVTYGPLHGLWVAYLLLSLLELPEPFVATLEDPTMKTRL